MSDLKKVSRALISVSDKNGIVDFARALNAPRRGATFNRRNLSPTPRK